MACGPEGRRGEELGDEGANDGGLGQDFIFEDAITDFDAGDETAGVDLEVPGFAGTVEGDDDFFVGYIKSMESDLGTLSPRTAVVGVEGYLGDVSLECLNVRERGGDVLLGAMPLLEVPLDTPLLTAADMLLRGCQISSRLWKRRVKQEKRSRLFVFIDSYSYQLDPPDFARVTK